MATLYSILSLCPADPKDSPIEWIIDFWRRVGPMWSPLADIGILLAVLGLLVPFLCVLIGAGFCVYYVKETSVALYLGFFGEHVQGIVIGMHTQNWAVPTSSAGSHYDTYFRATARYRLEHTDTATSTGSPGTWYKKDFLMKKQPENAARIDLLVSRRHPKISRIRENDMLVDLLLFAKLMGLLLISCIVGGLLLTMLIEIIPPMCPFKMQLWAGYAVLYITYAMYLINLEIHNGANSRSSSGGGERGERQGHGGYEYIPDVDLHEVAEDRPTPVALPVAEPISRLSSFMPFAVASPIRSIFGFRHTRNSVVSTSQEYVPAAVATVAQPDATSTNVSS